MVRCKITKTIEEELVLVWMLEILLAYLVLSLKLRMEILVVVVIANSWVECS